jgi:hypothetical protein
VAIHLVLSPACLRQAEPNSEQLQFLVEKMPTFILNPTTTTTDPIKLIKTEASHLKINTSKIQAETIDQTLLSSLTADSSRAGLTPIMESHYLQKKLVPGESHKQRENQRRIAKGSTLSVPLLLCKGCNTPAETAIRKASGCSTSYKSENM